PAQRPQAGRDRRGGCRVSCPPAGASVGWRRTCLGVALGTSQISSAKGPTTPSNVEPFALGVRDTLLGQSPPPLQVADQGGRSVFRPVVLKFNRTSQQREALSTVFWSTSSLLRPALLGADGSRITSSDPCGRSG